MGKLTDLTAATSFALTDIIMKDNSASSPPSTKLTIQQLLNIILANDIDVEVLAGSLTLDASGNIGIGTSSPSTKLHVVGPDGGGEGLPTLNADTVALFQNNSGSPFDGSIVSIISASAGVSTLGFGDNTNAIAGRITYENNTDTMFLYTNDTDKVSIDSDGAITATGTINNTNTTDSSSSTTGALKTAGGMGIAKKLFVGTDLSVSNMVKITTIDTWTISSNGSGNRAATGISVLKILVNALFSLYGFSGGVAGQILKVIIDENSTGSFSFVHANAGGTQKIYIRGGTGGATVTDGMYELICDGSRWYLNA